MASPKALLPLLVVAALSLSPLCFHAVAAEEFDFFTLALYWSNSICETTMNPHCCFENQCCRLNLPEFAIHGFWPDYTNGSWPKCCSNTPLVESDISSLIPALVEYWPKLYCGENTLLCNGEKGNQWAYEWGQHGTCASPYLGDSFNYFQKALSLYTKYNISSVLANGGIQFEPLNEAAYLLSMITGIIENAVGAKPAVICKGYTLYQLRLCFNKDFTPRDCVSTDNSCLKYIVFPERPSGKFIDGNAAITRMLNRKTFKPLTLA